MILYEELQANLAKRNNIGGAQNSSKIKEEQKTQNKAHHSS